MVPGAMVEASGLAPPLQGVPALGTLLPPGGAWPWPSTGGPGLGAGSQCTFPVPRSQAPGEACGFDLAMTPENTQRPRFTKSLISESAVE